MIDKAFYTLIMTKFVNLPWSASMNMKHSQKLYIDKYIKVSGPVRRSQRKIIVARKANVQILQDLCVCSHCDIKDQNTHLWTDQPQSSAAPVISQPYCCCA